MNVIMLAILALDQAPPVQACEKPAQAPTVLVRPAVVVRAPNVTVAVGRPRSTVVRAGDGSSFIRVNRGLFRRPVYVAVPAAQYAPSRPTPEKSKDRPSSQQQAPRSRRGGGG